MLAVFVLACNFAIAQTIGTGAIQGTVFDATGAVLPGATVKAVNPATGFSVTQQSSASGVYVLGQLPPADYTVTVSAAGFEQLQQKTVTVNALSTVGLDLHLKLGNASETVTVSGAPPQLNTTNGTLEVTIPNSTYSALPLAMNGGPKSPMGFVTLLPGAVPGTLGINQLNGGPGETSFIYIQGLPVTTSELQGDARNINTETSTEVIDQFQSITSGVPAYYTGQGITNFILKSGTNQFHGDIYENVRNTLFDARDYFAATRAVEQQNEFGATIGGPIWKNRAFFFFNYDGWRYKAGANSNLYSLPTTAEQQGDFSALGQPIYDPATTVCAADGTCTRQQFPGNIIPASRISSISQNLQSYLPTVTSTALQNNFTGALTGGTQQNMYLGKVDLNVTSKNHAYFLMQYGNNSPVGLGSNGGPQLPLPYTSSRYGSTIVWVGQVGDTQTISEHLVNVFGVQFNRFYTPFTNPTTGGNYAAKAGITGIPTGQPTENFPPISFTGGLDAPTSWAQNGFVESFSDTANTFTYQDNVQWTHGRHNFTFGGQAILQQENTSIPSALDNFSFSNNETAGFDASGNINTTTGNSYASYLLGTVDSASLTQTSVATTGARYSNYALYAQDDWKLTPKMTVNLGVREVIPKPFVEVQNRNSWVNPTLANPAVGNFPGALQFAGNGVDSCHCSTQVQIHYMNLEPRVGFASTPRSDTVIRGSFSIIHYNAGALGGNASSQGTSLLGYSSSPAPASSNGGITPAFNWNQGFPAFTPPPFFDPTLNTGYNTTAGATGGGVTYNRPDTAGRSPYTENWNLTLEQQFGSATVLSLSYAASASRFVPVGGAGQGIYTDQINPAYMKLGSLLLADENPTTLAAAQAVFPGISVPYANFQGSIGQMLRPFPQYSSMYDPNADFGNGLYNSLQAFLQHRMSHGLYFLVSYTWSKSTDDTGLSAYNGAGAAARSAYNIKAESAVSAGNTPHILSMAYVYSLPFGKGHAWGGQNALTDALVGGWQLSGINTYTAGTPLGPFGSTCNVPYANTCYADFNPAFNGSPRINGKIGSGNPRSNPLPYINVNAFVQPDSYTFGDTPRTRAYGLSNPWTPNESVSLSKSIPIKEGISIKLQADAFNLFNRAVLGGMSTSISSSAFGQVTSQTNTPRELQFEGYVRF